MRVKTVPGSREWPVWTSGEGQRMEASDWERTHHREEQGSQNTKNINRDTH